MAKLFFLKYSICIEYFHYGQLYFFIAFLEPFKRHWFSTGHHKSKEKELILYPSIMWLQLREHAVNFSSSIHQRHTENPGDCFYLHFPPPVSLMFTPLTTYVSAHEASTKLYSSDSTNTSCRGGGGGGGR